MKQQKILVAVDFSPDSKAALDWALDLGAQNKASVTILHVIHDPADDPGFYRHGEGNSLLPMENEAGRMLEEFLVKAGDSEDKISLIRSATAKLVEGLPAKRIIEFAEKNNVDHIVMGGRGVKGLKGLMVGSTTKEVFNKAKVPVTVVKSG